MSVNYLLHGHLPNQTISMGATSTHYTRKKALFYLIRSFNEFRKKWKGVKNERREDRVEVVERGVHRMYCREDRSSKEVARSIS